MKKNLLIATLLGAFTASSFAQGVVNFSAGGNKIRYTTDGSTLVSVPAGASNNVPSFGGISIALYVASNGTVLGTTGASSVNGAVPDLSAWTIQSSALMHTIGPGPAGSVLTTAVTLGSAANPVELEIVGWTGNFGDFASAVQGGALVGWTGGTLSLGAFGWSQPTGTTLSPVAVTTGSAVGFNGLVLAPIPEPGTMLLGGLGAAALLLFRRRK